jgi:lysophospholipase L1-like esterase
MVHILAYGDSLTWGIVPGTRERLPFPARWPGVMESELAQAGRMVRVTEDSLNGRRTVWDDPFKPGRNGLTGLEQRIEAHSPLALVIVMLGINDFQSVHQYDVSHSAQGIGALVAAIRRAPIEPGMPTPDILVVAPPPAQESRGPMAWKFAGAASKSVGLADAYRQVATELNCHFLDAGLVVATSAIDGVHLDADQHLRLGRELAPIVGAILSGTFDTPKLDHTGQVSGLAK